MYLAIGLIICLFVIIIIFSFPQFSPIPYFPSNGRDIPLILKALNIRSDQTIIDLGAGDGIVIFRAAERAFQNKCNTKFIAVEINPILLLILHIRRLLHPNRKNIKIINTDMFSINYSLLITNHYPLRPKVWAKGPSPFGGYRPLGETTFYIYISPWFIERTVANIAKQIQYFDLVSYFYQVKCLFGFKEELSEGVHRVFRYEKA